MKYIVRKVVDAKSIKECLKNERDIKPVEVYLSEDEFKSLSVTNIVKDIGFNHKK